MRVIVHMYMYMYMRMYKYMCIYIYIHTYIRRTEEPSHPSTAELPRCPKRRPGAASAPRL